MLLLHVATKSPIVAGCHACESVTHSSRVCAACGGQPDERGAPPTTPGRRRGAAAARVGHARQVCTTLHTVQRSSRLHIMTCAETA